MNGGSSGSKRVFADLSLQEVEIKVNNEAYKIKKSKLSKIEKMVEKELEQWVEQQEKNMNPEEYLKLLCRYEEYLGVKQ